MALLKGRGEDDVECRRGEQRKNSIHHIESFPDVGSGFEASPAFCAFHYEGNFSVASERAIKGLTAAGVERDFRDILLWTPQGGGTSRRAERFGSKLRAMETPGDGDCLLHALSISALGCEDHGEVLRSALRDAFQDESKEASMLQAYIEGQHRRDMDLFPGMEIEVDRTQMEREFLELRCADVTSKSYLYDFHVFVMANILRRPIVVYGEKTTDDFGDS